MIPLEIASYGMWHVRKGLFDLIDRDIVLATEKVFGLSNRHTKRLQEFLVDFRDMYQRSGMNQSNCVLVAYHHDPSFLAEVMAVVSKHRPLNGHLAASRIPSEIHPVLYRFNTNFILHLPSRNAARVLIGHEIGHEANGDIRQPARPRQRRRQELRADVYSLFLMNDVNAWCQGLEELMATAETWCQTLDIPYVRPSRQRVMTAPLAGTRRWLANRVWQTAQPQGV